MNITALTAIDVHVHLEQHVHIHLVEEDRRAGTPAEERLRHLQRAIALLPRQAVAVAVQAVDGEGSGSRCGRDRHRQRRGARVTALVDRRKFTATKGEAVSGLATSTEATGVDKGAEISGLASEGKRILFIGTKRQAQDAILEEANRCGMFYVNNRWLGGTLTNFTTVRKSIERLKEIESLLNDADKEMSKKERAALDKERDKLQKNLIGIREMDGLPDALFVIDPKKEYIAVQEAKKLGIPVVAIVDTNCDPEDIDYVIPGNDDAMRAIQLYAAGIADAVLDGVAGFHLHRGILALGEKPQPRPLSDLLSDLPDDAVTDGERLTVKVPPGTSSTRKRGWGSTDRRLRTTDGTTGRTCARASARTSARTSTGSNGRQEPMRLFQ